MKKAITFAAIVCLAAMTHAASLNWGGFIYNNQADDILTDGAYATLILLDGPVSSVTQWDYTTGLTDAGGTVMATYSISGAESAGWQFGSTFERSDAAGGVDGDWMIVVYDPGNTPDYFGWYSANISGITDTSSAGDLDLVVGWGPGEFLDAGAQLQVVPEPTSLALLGLGVAALGLRRRFKK